jgi:alkyl sulfatase BDS1-like metallo-beta-lactamase superfamily hydrolase
VIAHARFQECRQVWISLGPFYKRRSSKLWGGVLGERSRQDAAIREVVPDITFEHSHRFEAGGRRFELFSTPGGESLDALVVWLAQDRLAITGNLFGPIFGEFPNLYTIRGDRIRSAMRFVDSLELVRALEPETIVTGHEVVTGWQTIDATLTRVRDAVRYVLDRTIEGMNAGRDVHDLMREIVLPDDLRVGQGHGKVSWCVRAIWEEHAGWFHYDSTTSLYPVPRTSVAGDLVELAGGTGPLVTRAERHIDHGDPLQALHLIELALAVEPDNRRSLETKLRAHTLLLERSGRENFSEVKWLEAEMEATRQALAVREPPDTRLGE